MTGISQDTNSENSVTFSVVVVPRSSTSEIVGRHDGSLKVRLTAPPVEGAANEEMVKLLAKAFRVPRRCVEILSGHASRRKKIRIYGAASSAVREVLES